VKIHPRGGKAGTLLTVTGLNFAATRDANRLLLETIAVNVTSLTTEPISESDPTLATSVVAIVPKLPEAKRYPVFVEVFGAMTQSRDYPFTYYERVDFVRWSDAIAQAFAAVIILGMIMVFVVAALVIKNRENKIIKSIAPEFCMVILLGANLLLLSILMFIGRPTQGLCFARLILPCIGFVMLYGTLVVKTFRIYRIFENKSLKVRVITNANLMKKEAMIVALMSFLLLIECLSNPLRPEFVYLDTVQIRCESKNGTGNSVILNMVFGVIGLILLVGVWLSWKTRRVDNYYNESKHIAFSIYTVVFFGAFGGLALFQEQNNTQNYFAILAAVGTFVIFLTIAILFVPRLLLLYFPDAEGEKTDKFEWNNTKSGSQATVNSMSSLEGGETIPMRVTATRLGSTSQRNLMDSERAFDDDNYGFFDDDFSDKK
jgi:peptidoglycan/LPS O-acetylase OafA/YrhL